MPKDWVGGFAFWRQMSAYSVCYGLAEGKKSSFNSKSLTEFGMTRDQADHLVGWTERMLKWDTVLDNENPRVGNPPVKLLSSMEVREVSWVPWKSKTEGELSPLREAEGRKLFFRVLLTAISWS